MKRKEAIKRIVDEWQQSYAEWPPFFTRNFDKELVSVLRVLGVTDKELRDAKLK